MNKAQYALFTKKGGVFALKRVTKKLNHSVMLVRLVKLDCVWLVNKMEFSALKY